MKTIAIGSEQHRFAFLDDITKEAFENSWKNELHLIRLNDERALIAAELDSMTDRLANKGKPAANVEEKAKFVLQRDLEHKDKEIAEVNKTLAYNQYLYNDLIPRYVKSLKPPKPQ